eukprot:2091833-Amphidinium_carterae.1
MTFANKKLSSFQAFRYFIYYTLPAVVNHCALRSIARGAPGYVSRVIRKRDKHKNIMYCSSGGCMIFQLDREWIGSVLVMSEHVVVLFLFGYL